MDFYQVAPVLHHPYLNDGLLRSYLKRMMPAEAIKDIDQELRTFGERILKELEPLSQDAESRPPVHIPYDPWGKRIDEIKVSSAWNRLHEIAAEEGIVASGYERKYGEHSRIYQFAKLYLYHPSSAIYSCPLAMTDGAARVIELHGSEAMKKRALKHLTSRDPKIFWTSGQWMTERTGGSDVSGTSTIAKKDGDLYHLHGVKWFTSATTSQMAMTLAHIEGEDKLSLFYVELRDENGNLQNIQINRLKDKMGTKALPTAELTLSGTPATLVGDSGKGVKTIATLFNITRLYNACCAVGYMQRGLSLAIDYSKKREAFGKTILNHGLHAETLSDLQVRFEASFLMTFHAASLQGKEETGKSSEVESGTLRLLIPLVKLYTAKEGVNIASEVIESFGGAGYIEDTGLPQILRNAQVLAIWEGTTNVLSLDALRAIRKENAGVSFLKDIVSRLEGITVDQCNDLKTEILLSAKKIESQLSSFKDEDNLSASARILAMNLSKVYCASLLLDQAQWSLIDEKNSRSFSVAQRFIERGLLEEVSIDKDHRKESLSIIGA
jgi:putative acyl-CoA dehydrogenase